nr:PREDICTED: leucine-rich repeat and IQ domain-containing protein 3 [Latimeria chalumnae]|eukprot:XP_006003357.1 PREDICTED: leucine-rich repeat and IQ domain-containing protein 3 [Latimeria chalumnae]
MAVLFSFAKAITELPGTQFWAEMKNLLLLYLHNNNIGELEDILCLSSCPNLLVLTMFDTPISLQENYRHFVVNSTWSLKALDNYVISDEEIIEDWPLPEKFQALNPHLFVDLCTVTEKEASFQDEINLVNSIITRVNYTLAHFSPMIIIQRWLRGHLTRKKLGITLSVVRAKYKSLTTNGTGKTYDKTGNERSFVHHLLKKDTQDKSLCLTDMARNLAERVARDTILFQTANERFLQARKRVAALKAQQAMMEAMYPVPVDQHVLNKSQSTGLQEMK